MSRFIYLLFIGLIVSCGNETVQVETPNSDSTNQPPAETVSALTNQVDENGLKQGYFIVKGSDDPAGGYPEDAILREGNFQDNIPVGQWIYYAANGNVDSVAYYKTNKFGCCQRDSQGEFEGYWIFHGRDIPEYNRNPMVKICQGFYEENQKTGNWYYSNQQGLVDSIVTFEKGKRTDAIVYDRSH